MPIDSPEITRPKPTAGTRTGNGSTLLAATDGRTTAARRYRELCAALTAHLPQQPTAPQAALIRRAAQISVWAEGQEAAFARGGDFDILTFTTAANALRRLLQALGIERQAPDPLAFMDRRR